MVLPRTEIELKKPIEMSETTLPSILLCEDDPNLGRLLSDYLKRKDLKRPGPRTVWKA